MSCICEISPVHSIGNKGSLKKGCESTFVTICLILMGIIETLRHCKDLNAITSPRSVH